MKFIFEKKISTEPETLLISVGNGEIDEIVREGETKKLVLGLKKKQELNRRKLILLFRKIICLAKKARVKKIALNFDDFNFKHLKIDSGELAELMATNFLMANYEFNTYKTAPEEGWNYIEEVKIGGALSEKIKKGFLAGEIIGEEVNNAREMANTPGGDMTPSILAEKVEKLVKGLPIKATILGESEMERLKMGAILAVGQGSEEESKFIILEYFGGKKKDKPIVLIGKGVTFDTGGLSLKPSDSMLGMNLDMSGAAAVSEAVILAAKLKLKKNIVALVPAVENSPSGKSYRPGDIVKSMSGKTIEILNTDAEGRVILADALNYAKKYDPQVVIDVATLTGAAIVVIGDKANIIFSRDERLLKNVQELGEKSGDYVWPLPLWEEYENDVKGTFGDIVNTHSKKKRDAGSIMGAIFLLQFAKDFKKWMHIDMAPRMEATSDEFLSPGAAGSPVRLLIEYLRRS